LRIRSHSAVILQAAARRPIAAVPKSPRVQTKDEVQGRCLAANGLILPRFRYCAYRRSSTDMPAAYAEFIKHISFCSHLNGVFLALAVHLRLAESQRFCCAHIDRILLQVLNKRKKCLINTFLMSGVNRLPQCVSRDYKRNRNI
jgi:hypothetical protein